MSNYWLAKASLEKICDKLLANWPSASDFQKHIAEIAKPFENNLNKVETGFVRIDECSGLQHGEFNYIVGIHPTFDKDYHRRIIYDTERGVDSDFLEKICDKLKGIQ